jgi:hypothetical protein
LRETRSAGRVAPELDCLRIAKFPFGFYQVIQLEEPRLNHSDANLFVHLQETTAGTLIVCHPPLDTLTRQRRGGEYGAVNRGGKRLSKKCVFVREIESSAKVLSRKCMDHSSVITQSGANQAIKRENSGGRLITPLTGTVS